MPPSRCCDRSAETTRKRHRETHDHIPGALLVKKNEEDHIITQGHVPSHWFKPCLHPFGMRLTASTNVLPPKEVSELERSQTSEIRPSQRTSQHNYSTPVCHLQVCNLTAFPASPAMMPLNETVSIAISGGKEGGPDLHCGFWSGSCLLRAFVLQSVSSMNLMFGRRCCRRSTVGPFPACPIRLACACSSSGLLQ